MAKQTKDGLSRRDFLKGAAVVGAAGSMGAMGLPGIASATTSNADWLPEKWDYTTDVVVVGYGFAAQAAAIEAAKGGANVIILEKAGYRERGGNSRVCGQGLIAPSSNIWGNDTVPGYKDYIKAATEGQGYPTTSWNAPGYEFTSDETIKLYVEQSYTNRDWFASLGWPLSGVNMGGSWIPFYPDFPGADAIGSEPQWWTCNTTVPGHPLGGNVWYNLEDVIKKQANIEVKYKTPAKRLIQNPKNREVIGIVVTQAGVEKTIKARKAVVVAAGGYEFNQDMIKNFSHMTHCYSIGTPMNTGETIKMCWDAGAAPRNMGVTAAPTYWSAGILPGYKSALQIYNYPSKGAFIMVGRNNKRFRDEFYLNTTGLPNKGKSKLEGTRTYSGQEIRGGAYVPQDVPEPMHFIMDEVALKTGGSIFNQGANFGWATHVEGFKPSADNSAELANGWIIEANGIDDLATKTGRDPVALRATIEKWNADCALGKDTQFDFSSDPSHVQNKRPAARLLPFDLNGKFYAVRVYQLTLNTQGGMVRNLKSQVMSIDGPPIPRLYAAGENGDIWTILYQCMSNVGGGCITYGRIAGEEAAKLSAWDASATASRLGARRKVARKPVKKATRK